MSILSFGLGSSRFSNEIDFSSSPGIIRDNLLLHVDPGNIKSYNSSISPNILRDLSGNNRHVNLYPTGFGATYSSTEGGGSLLYNGSTHYGATSSTAFNGTQEIGWLSIGSSVTGMVSDGTNTVTITISTTTASTQIALRRIAKIGSAYTITGCNVADFNKSYTILNSAESVNGSTVTFTLTLVTVSGTVATNTTLPTTRGTHTLILTGLTIEWWFKPDRKVFASPCPGTANPACDPYQEIIGWRSNREYYLLWRDADGISGTLDAEFRSENGGDVVSSWNNTEFNTWKHVIATCDKFGLRRLYVNGVQRGNILTGTNSLDGTSTTGGNFNPGDFRVGGNTNSWHYKGYMGTVRVYKREFSATDVTTNFNATKSRYGVS